MKEVGISKGYMHKGLTKLALGSLVLGSSLMSLEAKSKLSDVIDNATIHGFAFTRVHSLHGYNGEGTRWQWRFKPTITTGEVAGWSASAGIFFSKGSSTPDSNDQSGDIGGSRGDTTKSLVDRFSIGDFFITYNGTDLGTKTTLIAGQRSPGTVFNDNNLDRALGVFVENRDLSALNVGFQWWDTWMSDDIYISVQGINSTGAGINNNMFMLYLKSGDDFTKDTGLSYNLWYGYINRWVDAMIFGDVGYTMKFGGSSLTFLAQSAFTKLTNNPHILGSTSGLNGIYTHGNKYDYAKNRGMANVRVDFRQSFASSDVEGEKPNGSFGVAVGAAGSFGDGYGALIDNTGGLKLGGHIWNSFSGAEANGFGILGAGSFNNSWIFVPYLKVDMSYKKFGAALDLAYVAASHFFYLKKNAPGYNLNGNPGGLFGDPSKDENNDGVPDGNAIAKANFVDVALSATYKFTDSLNMLAAYGWALAPKNVGPSFGRFRFQVNYVF